MSNQRKILDRHIGRRVVLFTDLGVFVEHDACDEHTRKVPVRALDFLDDRLCCVRLFNPFRFAGAERSAIPCACLGTEYIEAPRFSHAVVWRLAGGGE